MGVRRKESLVLCWALNLVWVFNRISSLQIVAALLFLDYFLCDFCIYFFALACSALSPKLWFHIADLFLPFGSYPTACHLRDMPCKMWHVSVISGLREKTCSFCPPPSSCWWLCLLQGCAPAPTELFCFLLCQHCRETTVLQVCCLNLEETGWLLAHKTLYTLSLLHSERVAKSNLVCSHFQMLALSDKLLSYKVVHKLISHF